MNGRAISVAFVDLCGFSTFVSETEDAAVLAKMDAFFSEVASVVQGRAAEVSDFAGDGVVVLFASDGDPSPLTPATEVIAEVLALAPKTVGLLARAGVARAHAVVGEVGPGTYRRRVAYGPASKLAAALCDQAEPGEILVLDALSKQEPQSIKNGRTLEVDGRSFPIRVA